MMLAIIFLFNNTYDAIESEAIYVTEFEVFFLTLVLLPGPMTMLMFKISCKEFSEFLTSTIVLNCIAFLLLHGLPDAR